MDQVIFHTGLFGYNRNDVDGFVSSMQEKCSKLEKQVSELEQKSAELEKQMADLESRKTKMSNLANQEILQLKEERDALKQQLSISVERAAQKDSENSELSSELEEMKQDKERLQKDYEAVKATLSLNCFSAASASQPSSDVSSLDSASRMDMVSETITTISHITGQLLTNAKKDAADIREQADNEYQEKQELGRKLMKQKEDELSAAKVQADKIRNQAEVDKMLSKLEADSMLKDAHKEIDHMTESAENGYLAIQESYRKMFAMLDAIKSEFMGQYEANLANLKQLSAAEQDNEEKNNSECKTIPFKIPG